MEKWHLILKEALDESPELRSLLLKTLNVQNVTLNRWLVGDTTPKRPTLPQIPALLPVEYQERMKESLQIEFPWLSFNGPVVERGVSGEGISARDLEELIVALSGREEPVPASFALRVLGAALTSEESLLFWVVAAYVSQQLHILLGEEVRIYFLRCLPGADGKVRSLYHGLSQGVDLFEFPLLCGGNGGPGRALLSHIPVVWASLPATPKSCGAVSLQRRGRVGGCLAIFSERADLFAGTDKQMLLKWYGMLASLAFSDQEFYSRDAVSLVNLPSWERQREIFGGASFDEYFQDAREGYPELSQKALENVVLQKLERDLIESR